jgi:hypothetical protein
VKSAFGHTVRPMRLNERGLTSMAIENTKKVMVLVWKVIDVYTGVLHEKPPSLITN